MKGKPQSMWIMKGNNKPITPKYNLVEADDVIVAVVYETIVMIEEKSWMVDFGTTAHTCANKKCVYLL